MDTSEPPMLAVQGRWHAGRLRRRWKDHEQVLRPKA